MKKHYWWYIGGAILFFIIIAIIYYIKKGSSSITATTTKTSGSGIGTAIVSSIYSKGNNFPIGLYSNGSNVLDVQKALNALGESLVLDGKFGALSVSALIRKTGKDTITSDELATLKSQAPAGQANNTTGGGTSNNVSPSNASSINFDTLAQDLKSDLEDKTYILGRQDAYPYTALLSLSYDNIAVVEGKYNSIVQSSGKNLYNDIKSSFFRPGTTSKAAITSALSDIASNADENGSSTPPVSQPSGGIMAALSSIM